MADVFLYADETGNLDYGGAGKSGASPYFGFGTVVFPEDHGTELMQGLRLRADVTEQGVHLPRGFHAVNDSTRTRTQMFDVIRQQAPRIDTTFLYKDGAYPAVRAKGQMHLYKMAWYLHFKEIALQVARPSDRLFVVVGTFGTSARRSEAKSALHDVCQQVQREIVLCVWEAGSSWGLQVADYCLWAAHRSLVGGTEGWYRSAVAPTLKSAFTPWGRAPKPPTM